MVVRIDLEKGSRIDFRRLGVEQIKFIGSGLKGKLDSVGVNHISFKLPDDTEVARLNPDSSSFELIKAKLQGDLNADGHNITNVGNVLPKSDNAYDLGSASARWANIHAVNVYANGLDIKGDALFYFNRIHRGIGWPVQYDNRAVSFIIPGFRDVLYCAVDRGFNVTVNREPDNGYLADMFRFASKTLINGAVWKNVSDTNPVQIEIDVGNVYINVIVIEFGWRNRLAIDYTIEIYHDNNDDGTYVWVTLADVVGNSAYVVAHEARRWRVRKIRITVTKAGDGDQAGILHIANIQALSSVHGVGFPHCLSVLGGTMYGTINAQDMLPKLDNTYSLGSESARWKEIYSMGGKFYGDVWIYNGERLRLKRTADVNTGVEFYDDAGERKFVFVFDTENRLSCYNAVKSALVWKTSVDELIFYVRDVRPYSDNAFNLGSSSLRWANVYADCVRPTEIIFPADDGVEYLIRTEDSKAVISLMHESDVGGDIKFAVNSIVYLELMGNNIIYVGRDVIPRSDNIYWLGSSSRRWSEVHAVNVYTGDINLDNGWKITEYNDDGEIIRGIRILNDKNEEVFRVTEDGVWFKGKKIVE